MEESLLKKKNNKRTLVAVLLALGLIFLTIGVSVAFFNYTRTGSENVLAVGRIYFNSTQGTSINLTNVFPVKSTELENNSNVASVTLTIRGDTTYDEGLEYLISADQVVNTINNKHIPIGTEVTVNNLGTSDDSYFENRGGNSSLYKVLSKGNIKEDGELVVGYITKGATGVNGSVTVKAFIDADKIAITDTPDENSEWQDDRTVFTTTEWNSFNSTGLSFKLRVEANEGVWVNEPLSAYGAMQSNADTVTVINFADPSNDSNGKGLYRLPGTENDEYPIYYYRGAIDNNNVVFAGFCWQMVRTTETGGTKMIYNGLPDITGSGDNITYNCGKSRNIQDTIMTTTSLQQSTGYYYADDYEIVSTGGNSVTYKLKSKTNPITQVAITDATAASTNIPTIVANYPYTCKQTTDTGTCKNLYKVDSYESGTNANVYDAIVNRTTIGISAFNSNYTSISDVGYMSNTRYPYSSSNWTTDALFASSATWVTDHYELTDASVTTPDTTHHYSCNKATSDATCTRLIYVYYVSGTIKYSIALTGGDLIEDALYKMTGNGDATVVARNSSYNLNVNSGAAKTAIDNWFRTNLTSEVDTNNLDYSVYLEDTVYCNDRSYKTTGSSNTFTQSGWNPGGGSLSTYLYFGTWNRYQNSYYSTTNVPSVACPNETDRFTVSNTNGNGALTYPVGLLTADEIIMAGEGGNNESTATYYLYTNDYYWSLSPSSFDMVYAREVGVYRDNLSITTVNSIYGLRPVVSLRLGTEFESGGDGTGTNPYIVKYN